MLKKIRIEDNGDTEFLPGTMVDILEFEDINEKTGSRRQRAGRRKTGSCLVLPRLLWQPNSFLSAASFQETTKVLTEAAIKGKVDPPDRSERERYHR